MSARETSRCACGSGLTRGECCGPILCGAETAETAQALMRSRYSAFMESNSAYLLESWHPDSRPDRLELNPEQRWLGMKVLSCEGGSELDDEGMVEFVARYKIAGRGYRLHELSRFVRTSNGWLYVDGVRGPTDSGARD